MIGKMHYEVHGLNQNRITKPLVVQGPLAMQEIIDMATDIP